MRNDCLEREGQNSELWSVCAAHTDPEVFLHALITNTFTMIWKPSRNVELYWIFSRTLELLHCRKNLVNLF